MNAQLQFHLPEAGDPSCDLVQEFNSIGRDPGNTIQIDHPSVSGKHAVLVAASDGFRLHDQASTNGTSVNDCRITTAELRDGDQIRLGDVRATFRSGSSPAVPPLPSAEPVTKAPRSKKRLLSTLLIGCGCTLFIVTILIVALLVWFSHSIQGPTASDALGQMAVLIPAKVNKDMSEGMHPAVSLGNAVKLLDEMERSPELRDCPEDVREAYREFVSAMKAWKREADDLPTSETDSILRSFLNGLAGKADGGYSEMKERWDSRVRAAQNAGEKLAAAADRHHRR